MSIRVNDLSKNYGLQTAVDGISFTVQPGEIVGFLGPNGAGKSTTMKILTGFIPPDAGTALILNEDVTLHPMRVKKRIGYLPEHNPLYLDMYVREYLHFMAGLFRLSSSSRRERIADMIHLCGITAEQDKKIGALSKGYRQRVGLAQALLHNPDVLILDEPTSGLDPNQLIEIRGLIKTVSRNKTVLFSTHILQEAEALCDRVIVINKGKIVADDKLDALRQAGQNELVVEFGNAVTEAELATVAGILSVQKIEKYRFRLTIGRGDDIRPALVRFAVDKNLSLLELKQGESSLESIFSQLTRVEKESAP